MTEIYYEDNRTTLVVKEITDETANFMTDYLSNVYDKGCKIVQKDNAISVTFDGCDDDLKDFIFEELLVLSLSQEAIDEIQEFNVKGLKSPTQKFGQVIVSKINNPSETKAFSDGPYKGLNPNQALDKYGVVAMIEMMKDNPYNKEIKENIIQSIQSFVVKNYKNLTREDVFKMDIEQVKNFIKIVELFLDDSIKAILSRAMYKDIDMLLQNAPEEVIKSAYVKLTRDLCQKFNV